MSAKKSCSKGEEFERSELSLEANINESSKSSCSNAKPHMVQMVAVVVQAQCDCGKESASALQDPMPSVVHYKMESFTYCAKSFFDCF